MNFRTKSFVVLLVIPLAFSVWGCNRAKFMANNMTPIVPKMNAAAQKMDDIDLMRQAGPHSLIFLEGLLEASPHNRTFLLRAAEGYAGYTFAYVEDEDPKRAAKLYRRARGFALRLLEWNTDFMEAMEKSPDEFEETLQQFDQYDVPGLFFLAQTWLSEINVSRDDPAVLVDIPKAEAVLKRVLELNDSYNHGLAHTMMGGFYAGQPQIFGGDPVKAKYHFDRGFLISQEKFLPMYIFYAKLYAYQIQDRELFVETLEYIINAPDDLYPEKRLANEIAKVKAKALLAEVDEYF
jgi:hypothetical protein